MDQTDLLWALLKAQQFEAIKNLDPEGIDFGRLHRTNGRTFLVEAADFFLPTAKKNQKEQLDCVRRLVSWGASPVQTCSKDANSTYVWKGEKKASTKIEVDPSGLSAISYVEEWIRKLTYHGSPWGDEIESMGQVLACFVTAFQKEKAGRVSIHEGIAELWEKCLAAKTSHDLTFKTADGEVTAHAHILKEASSVVGAMLASPMKEGQAQIIEVKDASSSSVSLFLERLVCISEVFIFILKNIKIVWLCHQFSLSVRCKILLLCQTNSEISVAPLHQPGYCTPVQHRVIQTTTVLCKHWIWHTVGKSMSWWQSCQIYFKA